MRAEVQKQLSKDPKLKKVMTKMSLAPLPSRGGVYEALIRSIVGQQLSIKAAASIYKRFLALFENEAHPPEAILKTDHEVLRGCGFSNSKAKYVKNVAQYFLDNPNEDWESLSDEAIIEKLTSIKGVGRWTVEMILMFALFRENVFPIGDLGVRNGMIALYDVKSEGKTQMAELTEIAEQWKPFRSYGSRLMWLWKDSTAASLDE